MASRLRNKEDVETHGTHWGYDVRPAVNVKIYDSLATGYRKFKEYGEEFDPKFTLEWIEENVSTDALDSYWEFACERGWEELQDKALEIYGADMVTDRTGRHLRYRVYSTGRSGGWAYIDGINSDIDSWDAIEFTQWKRFAEFARAVADNVMADVVDSIYFNEFEVWKDEQSELAAPNYPEGIRV